MRDDRVGEGRIKRNDLCPAAVDHHSSVVVEEIHDVALVQVREINTVHTQRDLLRETNPNLGHVGLMLATTGCAG